MSADRERPRARTEPGRRPVPRDPDVDLRVRAQRWELAGHRLDVLGTIALGGVLGAEARYGLSVVLPHAPGAWPWATLLTNVSGCLLIGVLMAVITDLVEPHRLVRPFLGVGVLGGYTTFSTYSTDLVQMLDAGRPLLALGYLAVTPLGALAAVWAGTALTRAAARLGARRSEGDL